MRRLIVLPLALWPAAAIAHARHGAGEGGAFLAGLAHPTGGADHLLAMVAVGLWAAVLGGRAIVAVPATFLGAMLLGAGLGGAGLVLVSPEPMILASAVLLGAAVALAVRPALGVVVVAVAVFGAVHGVAHGAEAPAVAGLDYAAGFLVATAALHAARVGLGSVLLRGGRRAGARLLGAAASAAGVALVLAS